VPVLAGRLVLGRPPDEGDDERQSGEAGQHEPERDLPFGPALRTRALDRPRVGVLDQLDAVELPPEGVKDRGPSLIGVGEASVYFQTSTGRMPAMAQSAQIPKKPPVLTPEEVDAVAAYVEANGGGVQMPEERGAELRGDDPARGGELFRFNCASCHNFTGRGGALSSGKEAPALDGVTEDQMYAAMLSGPQNMPRFSERQLSPEEKKDIIAYVKSVTDGNNNPGGSPIGGLGPQSEGFIAFILGIAALLGVTLWIGAKA